MDCEISVVCSCRNDNYGENLLDRVCYFVRSLDRFSVPIEIILVEWNPLEGYAPLADILSKWNDLVPFHHPIRVITVSKENHERFISKFSYTDGYKSFQEYPSKNIGIRHARGKYIIQTNPDIFYPLSTIRTIENLIKTTDIQNVISCGNPRGKRIDALEIHNFPSIMNVSSKDEVLAKLINMENILLELHNLKRIAMDALGDFMLFKKEHALQTKSFKECPIALHHHEQPFVDEFEKHGWPENMIGGITIYHFDHSRVSYEKVDECHKVNPPIVTYEFLRSLVNDDTWGCADLVLSEREIHTHP
jgi:hypothetical protein